MGPVLLLAGIVLALLGAAGLLATGTASHSRMRTAGPRVHVAQIAAGVLLGSAGAAVLLSG